MSPPVRRPSGSWVPDSEEDDRVSQSGSHVIGYQGPPLGHEPHSAMTIGKNSYVTVGLMIVCLSLSFFVGMGWLRLSQLSEANLVVRLQRIEDKMDDFLQRIDRPPKKAKADAE